MLEHLKARGLDANKYPSLVVDTDCVTFPLWNLSGQMVGYQVYKPNGSKSHTPNPRDQKYYTYVSRYGSADASLAVWGLETISSDKPLFLVEGVFDACKLHSLGLSAVAVLSCDPKHLKPWFSCLPQKKVAVCDGDTAGKRLAKYADSAVHLPEGKDVGDLTLTQLVLALNKYL